MTVGELKARLANVPDERTVSVAAYVAGFLKEATNVWRVVEDEAGEFLYIDVKFSAAHK